MSDLSFKGNKNLKEVSPGHFELWRWEQPALPGMEDYTVSENSMKKAEKAKKFDAGKAPLSLLPGDALIEVAKVLDFGAQKYGSHNWLGGMSWSRLIDAALRHVFAWIWGEKKDAETGLSHLAHAACCILFLLTYENKNLGTNDLYIVEELKNAKVI